MEHTTNQNLLAPDVFMVVLTWGTFFALMFILKKFAWKPILDGLKKREDYIRKSLDDADQAKAELARIEQTKQQILNEAKLQASQIINDSRKVAADLAHDIENKAKSSAVDIVRSANAQIEGERQRARQALKKESANIAVLLASKLIKENMDTDRNRRLVDGAISQL